MNFFSHTPGLSARLGSMLGTTLGATVLGLGAAASALAAPVPEASPPALANGFQVEWAQVDVAPHSIADALNALAGTGGFTVLSSVTQTLGTISLSDASAPFAGSDPLFALRVTGYIELAAGTYQFASSHDDGALVTIGGETVITFDSDTSPTTTLSSVYTLPAGVYAFQAIGWEQGGQFDFQLGTVATPSSPIDLLSGSHAAAVPEPGTGALWLAGLAVLGGLAYRRRA